MTFPPFSEAEVVMARAYFTLTEPTMQTANDFARRMALLGKPGPYRASHANPGVIVDLSLIHILTLPTILLV